MVEGIIPQLRGGILGNSNTNFPHVPCELNFYNLFAGMCRQMIVLNIQESDTFVARYKSLLQEQEGLITTK
jgi:hypothetical protein